MDIQNQFAGLFQGRMNAYGTDTGGCDKVDPEPLDGWEAALTYEARIRGHLDGIRPMGVYPLTDKLEVCWGCTDLDYTDDPTQALDLATLLRTAGVNAWVEVSRSKGYHVWTFASEPIPAIVMRNAMLAVHQMLEIPATEVNPKQVTLEGLKGYGNYVRLPYPGALETPPGEVQPRQSVIAPDGIHRITLAEFVENATASRSTLEDYEKVAALYIAPPPPQRVDIDTEPELDDTLARKLGKPAYLALKYGPRDGHDRSSSLMRLAHLCREDGVTPAEALAVVRAADLRWGKFWNRADGDDQLLRMVTNAYQ